MIKSLVAVCKAIVLLSLLLFSIVNVAVADGLEAEVPILVGGQPLDVERQGDPSPAVFDYDGDGKKDLLITHSHRSGSNEFRRIQLYRNVGTNAAPRFEAMRYETDATPSGYLPAASSFASPQFVDIDRDGHRDLLTTGWPFELHIHRGLANGKLGSQEFLLDRSRMGVDGRHVGLSAADYDGDGDIDLMIGGGLQDENLGHVCLFRNESTGKAFKFAGPEPIPAGDKPIVAPDYEAAPVIADWNNDGKLDLVLGCGDGSVRWYANVGTRQSPTFGEIQILVPTPSGLSQRGKEAKPCVVDWNEDGRLDLIVGDHGVQFDKLLTMEELQWQQQARDSQAEIFTEWAGVLSLYRDLIVKSKASADDELLFKAEVNQLRGKLVELNAKRDAQFQQEQMLQPGRQYHGRVWLFLRKAE